MIGVDLDLVVPHLFEVLHVFPVLSLDHRYHDDHRSHANDDAQHGGSLPVELLEDLQHVPTSLGVQRASGFVGHDNGRMGGDGPGDGHPLLLATGHLAGMMVSPAVHPHPGQGGHGYVSTVPDGSAPVDEGEDDVVQGVQLLE